MGGEFHASIVYGFEVQDTYVKLRGDTNVCIGAKYKYGFPVYYCTDLGWFCKNNINVCEIQSIIGSLNKYELDKIEQFDIFAKRYGYKPSWQVICVGELEVKIASDSFEEVIHRFNELKHEVSESGEDIYDSESGGYNEDVTEGISIILLEENMGFMVQDALKTKDIESIIALINDFYRMD